MTIKSWIGTAAGALFGVATATAIVLSGPAADARTSYDSPYGFERTWNSAIRMVRVDMAFKVTEKDDTAGFLLFDYRSSEGGSKSSLGSIELVRAPEAGNAVHVIVQLPQMPRYHEQVMMDSLVRKLKAEYGEPLTQRARPKADAGDDAEP